ncbi:MAG: ABC transporter permease [Solobacterium sp.]|nr:ABC transporter permease [Solobacterium sp.]
MSQINKTTYYTLISPEHRLCDLKLKEVITYRELIVLFASKELRTRYKQTILGPLWLIIAPLMTSIMHMIVFGTIAGIGTEGMPKILFYLAGNSLWEFFSGVFTRCTQTFSGNAHLFGKVYFPRLTVPFSYILLSSFEFSVQFLIIIALCFWFSLHGFSFPYAGWLLIPLLLIWLGLLAMGLGIIVASLTTKYRDLNVLVRFGVQLWMYATPIVYPLSVLKENSLRSWVLINPVTAPAELFRMWVLGVGSISASSVVVSLTLTVISILAGMMIFNRIERSFMDTI